MVEMKESKESAKTMFRKMWKLETPSRTVAAGKRKP